MHQSQYMRNEQQQIRNKSQLNSKTLHNVNKEEEYSFNFDTLSKEFKKQVWTKERPNFE